MFVFFKNIKERFVEEWKNFENRLFESNTFNILKERYQSLSVVRQKSIKCLFLFFIVSVLAYMPFFYFFSSVKYWGELKEKQKISLELLKMRNKISNSIFRFSQYQMKEKIENSINKYSKESFTITEKRALIPETSIYQIDFNIHLKHLNIKQVVKLGVDLNKMSQSRLQSIKMEESQKYPKHYDVDYKLLSFVSKEKKPKKVRTLPKTKSLKKRQNKAKPFSRTFKNKEEKKQKAKDKKKRVNIPGDRENEKIPDFL